MLMLVIALTFTSCESCDNKENVTPAGIEWMAHVDASGSGYLNATFPFNGNVELEGTARFEANTSTDTVAEFSVPNGALTYDRVLADPAIYGDDEITLAKQIEHRISETKLDSISGKWEINTYGWAALGEQDVLGEALSRHNIPIHTR